MFDPYSVDNTLDAPPPAAVEPTKIDLSHLNAQQREAVETTEGPLLVLAGAGTGKTRVLTTRIAHILSEHKAFPSQILAVTFTNKAAKEMQARVSDMVGDNGAGVWLGTFHSICLKMLRHHAPLVGLPADFTVLDMDDQLRLVKQIVKDERIDDKHYPPKALAAQIDTWKNQALTSDKVEDQFGDEVEAKVYSIYQNRLKTLGVVDFGDLLLHVIVILQEHSDVLAEFHRRFKYILVDEYQDTNVAQYLWLRLLAQGNYNVCCVGDDDQSIYGWRGAEVGNILKFEQDFSVHGNVPHTIRLEQNYRSTPDILACASAVIAHNEERLGKTLFCEDADGEKVKVVSMWDERQEAAYVAQEVESLQQLKSESLDEMACLVRAGHQTRPLEEVFITNSIPYQIIGGLRFYERREIRDAIAYIRAMMQPTNDLALERIVNVPRRGVGNASLEKLRTYAREHHVSMNRAIRDLVAAGELKGKSAKTLSDFMKQLSYWRELLHEKPHHEVVRTLLQQSGYIAMWKADKSADSPGRVENLEELINALAEFPHLEAFLEHVSLVSDSDEKKFEPMVSVMTMHAAKGLEFNHVFLCGWEDGLFPSQRSMDEKGQNGLEEERRLAYVGITRARKQLTITFAANRFIFGQTVNALPSRFIDELPEEHIERLNTGMGAGYGTTADVPKKKKSFGKSVEAFTKEIGYKPINSAGFEQGQRVFHQKFGYGHIRGIKGHHLTIDFETSSQRTLLDDYVEAAD